ncbi:MAG: hypothetical protein K1060chlam2_01545 [Chlamydiae bacterium]|nr:hypothetical protein [Chlamydiota bacterium]
MSMKLSKHILSEEFRKYNNNETLLRELSLPEGKSFLEGKFNTWAGSGKPYTVHIECNFIVYLCESNFKIFTNGHFGLEDLCWRKIEFFGNRYRGAPVSFEFFTQKTFQTQAEFIVADCNNKPCGEQITFKAFNRLAEYKELFQRSLGNCKHRLPDSIRTFLFPPKDSKSQNDTVPSSEGRVVQDLSSDPISLLREDIMHISPMLGLLFSSTSIISDKLFQELFSQKGKSMIDDTLKSYFLRIKFLRSHIDNKTIGLFISHTTYTSIQFSTIFPSSEHSIKNEIIINRCIGGYKVTFAYNEKVRPTFVENLSMQLRGDSSKEAVKVNYKMFEILKECSRSVFAHYKKMLPSPNSDCLHKRALQNAKIELLTDLRILF